MRHHSLGEDPVLLSKSTAFAMCDGLIRMSHCLVIELPEPELREIRYMLDSLLVKADLALDLMEREISLDFGGLNVDIDPGESSVPVLFPVSSDIFQTPALPLGLKISAQSWSRPPPRRMLINRAPFPYLVAEVVLHSTLALPWPHPRLRLLQRRRFRFVSPLQPQSPP